MRSISVLLALSAGAMFAQDRYERLMRDILIFDAHIDTPRYFVDEGYKLADEHGYYELDIPRMKKGKLGAVLFGIYVQPQDFPPDRWLPRPSRSSKHCIAKWLRTRQRWSSPSHRLTSSGFTAPGNLRPWRASKAATSSPIVSACCRRFTGWEYGT
jgi:hypothetical protein